MWLFDEHRRTTAQCDIRLNLQCVEKTENRKSASNCAFAFRGRRISNANVEDNLREHLQKWSPFVQKFGLLVIELHTISPEITAKNIGRTAATAYNAHHGFSDQYIESIFFAFQSMD